MYTDYRKFIEQYLHITDTVWKQIAAKIQIVHLEKSQYILHQGDRCKKICFIHKGIARSFVIDVDGNDITWAFHFNDHHADMVNLFAVDYYSFLSRMPSTLSIEILQPCDLYVIEAADLETLCLDMPEIERFVSLMTQEAYQYLHLQLIEKMTKNARERLENLLVKSPHLFSKVPQYHIASLLGITPQYLSRLKKELEIASSKNNGIHTGFSDIWV